MSASLRAIVIAFLSVSSCRRDPAPTPSGAPLASVSSVPAPATSPPTSASAIAAPADSLTPVGGPWVRCYAHFRPTSTPIRDLTRLTMLCGPENGMRPLAEPIEEAIGEAPVDHPVKLVEGQCVRVFAVADSAIADLDLSLLSPGGAVLAVDAIDDRWPVLLPDRPLCVTETGKHVVRVRSRKGTGRYAMQAWLLP